MLSCDYFGGDVWLYNGMSQWLAYDIQLVAEKVNAGYRKADMYCKSSGIMYTKFQNLNAYGLILQLPCPIYWSQVLSQEWRCSWSSADRWCSNYIWVISKFIAYKGVAYIRGFTVNASQHVWSLSHDLHWYWFMTMRYLCYPTAMLGVICGYVYTLVTSITISFNMTCQLIINEVAVTWQKG